jgi:hypothetical protein
VQHKAIGIKNEFEKDFTGELLVPHYLICVGGIRPVEEVEKGESQNGLENPKNRGSAGRHGNQHVCVCRPQVSQRDSFTF